MGVLPSCTLEGMRRYINAFQAPLQELSALSLVQIHTLWACSLLAIPPPPERMPPQGGVPTDLLELNLLGWASLVQDMVAGLQALPPNLGHDMGLPAVALLQLLEASTRVGFCCYCCSPSPQCKCVGASHSVPPASWSQIVEQTPGYGVIASSGGMTTPSTFIAGMPGYVVPQLGLTPPDFSSWSLPPLEGSLPQGLPAALQGLPGIGRSIQIRATTERHAWAQLVQALWAPAQRAQMPPMSALLVVKAWRTMGDRGLEGRETVADLPVTPGECKRRQVGRRLIRRVISLPGQHQMFPQPQHLKVPHLSWAVGQGLCPMILHDWLPNTIAQDGKRTLSMCSRSTTSITSPPIRRQSG